MVLDMMGKTLLTLDDNPVKDVVEKIVPASGTVPEHVERVLVDMDMQRAVMHILGNAQGMDPRDASSLARRMKRTGQIEVTPTQLDTIKAEVERCQLKRGGTAENFFNADMKGQILEEIQAQVDASRKSE